MSTLVFSTTEIEEMAKKAIEDVFATMLSMEIIPKTSICITPESRGQTPAPSLDTEEMVVSGCVGFIGDIKGLVYIVLKNSFGVTLTSTMLGLDEDEVLAEGNVLINDALGELSNMIVGTFKNQMSDKGIHCNLTVPSILRGKKLGIDNPASQPLNRYYFTYEAAGQEVVLDIAVKPAE